MPELNDITLKLGDNEVTNFISSNMKYFKTCNTLDAIKIDQISFIDNYMANKLEEQYAYVAHGTLHDIKPEKQTSAICKAILRDHPEEFPYVRLPKEQTDDLALWFVGRDPYNIKYIPDPMRTDEVDFKAMDLNINVVKYLNSISDDVIIRILDESIHNINWLHQFMPFSDRILKSLSTHSNSLNDYAEELLYPNGTIPSKDYTANILKYFPQFVLHLNPLDIPDEYLKMNDLTFISYIARHKNDPTDIKIIKANMPFNDKNLLMAICIYMNKYTKIDKDNNLLYCCDIPIGSADDNDIIETYLKYLINKQDNGGEDNG